MDTLYQDLKNYGKVRSNEPLSKHTTFKIGGPAKYMVEISERPSLVECLNYLSEQGVDFLILGGGANILASDSGFDGVVIKNKTTNLEVAEDIIIADAGVLLSSVVDAAAANSLSGLEWAAGIPGTVGGAVRGNAGAMGSDTASSILKVEVWENGEAAEFNGINCEFCYRSSRFKEKGGVILRVWFKLNPTSDRAMIIKKMQENLLGRNKKIPKEASAGSFFKNIKISDWPGGMPVNLPPIFVERGMIPSGWLIEESGLKEEKSGDAAVSKSHGNIIINQGKASQSDVLSLVEKIQEKVYNKFGIHLEPEVKILK